MLIAPISNPGMTGVQYLATSAEVTAALQHEIFRQDDLGTLPDPLYSTPTAWRELAFIGQSNIQGRATGSVTGLPDAVVRTWMRSMDAGTVDPSALADLDYRDNGGTDYHGPWAFAQEGVLAEVHHALIVVKGGQSANAWNDTTPGAPRGEQIEATHRFRACIGCPPTRTDIIIGLGESDADLGTTKNTYKSRMTEMIRLTRELHGLDSRVHLVLLCDEMTAGSITTSSRNEINAGLLELADEIPHCSVIDMRAETGVISGDSLHYSAAGNVVLWDNSLASIEGAP